MFMISRSLSASYAMTKHFCASDSGISQKKLGRLYFLISMFILQDPRNPKVSNPMNFKDSSQYQPSLLSNERILPKGFAEPF